MSSAGSTYQFILANDPYQIFDHLSKSTFIVRIAAVVEDFGMHIVVTDQHFQDILICYIERMAINI